MWPGSFWARLFYFLNKFGNIPEWSIFVYQIARKRVFLSKKTTLHDSKTSSRST